MRAIEDLGREEINGRYFRVEGRPRRDGLELRGEAGRLLLAWR
ncbi:MAG TPA: hypothetical protein VGD62_10680 [Acidobacteriaceae bacterium]